MNYDNYYKNGGMTKEESVSAIALRIGAKKEAVAKFVEKNNIDTNKLNSDLKSGQVYFLDVITAIVGKPNNKYEKEIVKKYGNKMAMGGKTQGYDDREDERLGMDYGKISGKDFDGSHDMREHSRRDDARFEERMAKGGEFRANRSALIKYANFGDGSHVNLLSLNPIKTTGATYKDEDKFAISMISVGGEQKVMKFKTLAIAESKFEELVDNKKENVELVKEDYTSNYPNEYAHGGKLDVGIYRIGKPKRISDNLYEQKIVEIFDNGDISTASDYGRKLGDFKSQMYPIITQEQFEAQYKYADGGMMAEGGEVGDKVILLKGILINFPEGEYRIKKVIKGNEHFPEGFYDIENKDGLRIRLKKSKFALVSSEGFMADGGMMDEGGEVGDKVILLKGILINFPEGEYRIKKVIKGNEHFPEGFYDIENKDGLRIRLKKSKFALVSSEGFMADGGMMAEGGHIKEEGDYLLGYEPYFEKDVQIASIDRENKIVRPTSGYFPKHPMSKKAINWAKKHGYDYIADGKKYDDGGEIKVINLSDDDKLNYFIKKQELVEKQDREDDDYTFINDMLTTTYNGKKFYSLGYDTVDKGRVFSLEEAKKNAKIITDSQLGKKWDVIIKEVGGAFGEQDFTKKQYVVMTSPLFPRQMLSEMRGTLKYADGGYMAKGGEVYKIQQKYKYELQPKWEDEKFQTGGRHFLSFKDAQDFKKKLSNMSSSMEYKVIKVEDKMADGGMMARGGYVTDLDEVIASSDLKEELKSKMKEGDKIVAFAYTDYGGSFGDKVAIEYFKENHPKNIVFENSAYDGQNGIVFGDVAKDFLEETEDYPLGYEDMESFYYDMQNAQEEKDFKLFLSDIKNKYTIKKDALDWLLENKGGYYSIEPNMVDFSYSELENELEEEGLIKKKKMADGGMMAKGGKITRNKNKNDYNSMFNFFIENNDQPIGKRDLIDMAYASSNGVDSAIPQSMVGDVDNTAFYVYDYQTDKMGELVDLRMKLKFSNVKVDVTIVQNGELKYGKDLPYELENATFHQALNYVFTHDDVEQFSIRPRKKYAKGGAIEDQYVGRTAEDIWQSWNQEQKIHFFIDHKEHPYYNMGGEEFVVSKNDREKYVGMNYDDLPKRVKLMIRDHVEEGEYAKGGALPKQNQLNKKVDTADLVGHYVTINKADYSQATGKVVKVSEQKIMLDLTKGVKGVETNVYLTIEDENGKEHAGTLFVNYTDKVLDLIQKANIESKLELGQLVVSALTDANAHSEVRKFISIMENKPEWAKKPKDIDYNLPREEFEKQRAKTVYSSKYYDANEKINDLGIKIANMFGWDIVDISDALIFASKMSGRNDVAQALEKLDSDDDKQDATKNKWNYTDVDDIEYVVVKDKSGKELKFNGKDVISGVHDLLEKGGKLTEIGKYYSKNDVVSVFVNGKNILDKNTVSGVWIQKDAKPMAEDVADMKIGKTTIKKGVNGWVGKTRVDNFKGFDWDITTIKNSRGDLTTTAQGGKSEDKGGLKMFIFMLYQDPSIRLKTSRPARVNEKVVSEQHAEAMKDLKERQDEIAEMVDQIQSKKKMADGGAIGFDALAKKVAKNYEGDKVKKEFQDEYGKKYDKKEAEEVGKKVAGKVYRQQQAKGKMAKGGKVDKKNATPLNRSQNKMTLISRKASEIRKANEPWRDAFNRAKAMLYS